MTSNDPLDATQPGPQKGQPGPQQGPVDRTMPAMPSGGATPPADAGATLGGTTGAGKTPTGGGGTGSGTSGGTSGAGRTMQAPAGTPGPASPPPPAQDPLLGRELGGCRVDALLGRGAMGAVYKARQLRLDREVAIKVIRPELLTDARILKRFEVEARTVGRFNTPHVVMVHDVGFELGVHFLVMEFVKGKNLRDHTKLLAGGRLSVAEALPLLRQACKGLEEAQRLGVLHRDIKPDNLMLNDRGVLKIADFGIAKPTQEDFSMTMTSELIGTPLYMSPEQCQAAPDLDFRSDMYSLGATFYYLLTGEPPVRASSVYELIQTKTKLENLCLWKALPELDENHPLSRVIERMTALLRDDRYPSYEALVADLALVEQGRTMDIQRPKSRQVTTKVVTPPPKPPQKSSKGLAIGAVALLLAAGGGGYAWYATRPAEGTGGSGPVAPVAGSLPALRQRFAEAGPTPALRAELAAAAVAEADRPARDALLADVDQGLAAKAKLQALPAPADVEPPFADLRDHLQRVDAAVATTGAPGPELQQWLAGAKKQARAEAELGAKAMAKLSAAFVAWQEDRQQAAGDVARLAALGQRLDALEKARGDLLGLLPQLGEALAKTGLAEKLAVAKKALASGETAVVPVDVSKSLGEIRAEFAANGPAASLFDRAQKLQPNQPAQVEQRAQLLDAMQRAQSAVELARGVRATLPADPQLPFDDVATYLAAVERELKPLAGPDGALPGWAQKEREALLETAALQPKVLQRCRTAWTEWQQRRGLAAAAGPAELQTLGADLGKLRAALERGKQLFPAAAAQFDGIATAVQLTEAQAGLGKAQQLLQWQAATKETAARLAAVATLADWRAAAADAEKDLAARRTAAAGLGGGPEVDGELQRVQAIVERWRAADERVGALGKALGAGDFKAVETAVRNGVPGNEGREEFRALEQAAARARAAFGVLDQELDLGKASTMLGEARTLLGEHGALARPAVDRIERWQRAVQDLQGAAAEMVAIPGGRTKASASIVPAFFLGATEVRQRDYQKFLDEVQQVLTAANATEPAAMQRALEPRLGSATPPADVLQRMLERRSKLRQPELPVDAVTWYEAAAYAAWFHLALPTAPEWALAAFGDGNKHVYPWGDEWKDLDECRNIGDALVAADVGGRSWRSTDRAVVHHLAGNAAEWLAGAPTATEQQLAGGRYNDNAKEAKQRASGEDFHKAGPGKALPGFGFRVILRPRDALAKEFAFGVFPAGQ